ncbi:hypothetical protein HG535_0D03390 [Zygotorulaspora mrakii]|uniref:Uncharacterized protein n=1 Tax=Zygotorulaspora mrakii TaxID=42260 RepID=A0A7H9B1W6_ZYGMR|nr:uncharacterized protein HG535_0D03390 [Zygotorulaspora mrakii]QLG72631.1 hypothetical protein HG535_0D03390 [Zygotorulaspora mrakii]
MSEERQIIEQLTKTLELLRVERNEKAHESSSVRGGFSSSGHELNGVEPSRSFEDYSNAYIDFTFENPTTYHVIDYASKMFEKSGFEYLSEKENWDAKLSKGSKFYTIRNGTNLSAFVVGKKWTLEKGVGVIGSHADALTAKLKPSSKKDQVEGFGLLGVAPYGGTLNDMWFDRDLGIGGRVLYKDSDNHIKSKLINSAPHPIAKIPTLAPHFGAPAVGPFDKEDQAVPIISYASAEPDKGITEDEKNSPLSDKHDISVLRYIAKLAGVEVKQLVQLDLDLFDVQKGVIGGISSDFLFAPRLDDRLCTFAAVNSLVEYSQSINVEEMDTFVDVTLFDNEEIGSLSRQGAKGGLLESVVNRVSSAYFKDQDKDVDLRTLYANSIILSADVNHMFNPNFASVYMKNHSPKPNVGVTLSLDPNVHMSTDVVGTAFVEELARLNDDKVQYFQIKNNSRSGGTIGPSISSQTGARAIDLGIAQLSMHSIRAATGSKDIGLGIKFFRNFLKNWRPVYDQFEDL